MKQSIQSEAFRKAALRSEWYRIIGMLIVLGVLVLVVVIRPLFRAERHDAYRVPTSLVFLACGAGYELGMLWIARRADRAGRPPPGWVWVLNTVLECSVPTLALALLSLDKEYFGPYRALASPAVLMYFFFIILSALRLSPWLCILSGVVSTLGYIALAVLTRWLFPDNSARDFMPQQIYFLYPINIFCAGVIAAGVARQIRVHVIAALDEAETRRQLDRIEHDLNIARTIQMGLLPKKSPAVGGYEVAGFSLPADQTGGDYYDWIELPEGRVIFSIADATGHGIGPALLIAACRAYFRALAKHGDPLERMTAEVDSLIAADVPADRFITAAVALLEPGEHRLSLYSAGHAPLYLYVAATDEVMAFDSDQPPLGVGCGDGESKARVISFAPGDALVLVTDGFFECANGGGEQLGTERLGEIIRKHHGLGADEFIARMLEDVRGFTQGAAQNDDMTAVVIKRKAL